jgi:hypothetical protein
MSLPKVPQRTTSGFAFSIVQRAMFESLTRRKFATREILEVLAFFGADPPECVFCGDPNVARWDHLVPIKAGGDTVVGNMVPACSRCDDSKRHLPYMEWALSNAPHSPKSRQIPSLEQRLDRIAAYVTKYEYAPLTATSRLTPPELEHFKRICNHLADARMEFEALLSSYRARTGQT